jgi:RNA polymerase sigma factor (sigma-70 family)
MEVLTHSVTKSARQGFPGMRGPDTDPIDAMAVPFRGRFEEFFDASYPFLQRYLDRLTGDPDLSADLAQEAFVRLLRRGSFPEEPRAWLVSVAMNLLRNAHARTSRRRRLLTLERGAGLHGAAAPSAPEQMEKRERAARVRRVLNELPERDRSLLLLRAEGYSYRELAVALDINETSVGTLLLRARSAFEKALRGDGHAS